jgi:hypothetical protein
MKKSVHQLPERAEFLPSLDGQINPRISGNDLQTSELMPPKDVRYAG